MPQVIAGRWLKNVADGTIYGYSDLLAANPKVTEVTEEQAFPEMHIPEDRRGRVARVHVDDSDAPGPGTAPEIAADASRGLTGAGAGLKPPKK